jgi:thiol-disulfide isomerase/thioredoxin
MRFVSRRLRAGIFLIVPALWFVLIVGQGAADPSAPVSQSVVELRDVKYNGLVDAVKAQRGKVVVVDVWATFCPPCMRNYPHMLKMQKEYASQGLVCISVSVDLETSKAAALKFLKAKDSTITNFWLDETDKVWGARWGVNGPPVVFVFDRAGRRAGKFGTEENPASVDQQPNPEIEKLVKELLQAKP